MANETAQQTQATGQRGGGQRPAQVDAPTAAQPTAEPAKGAEQRTVAIRPAPGAVFDPRAGIRVGLLRLARNWAEEGHVYSAINTYKMVLLRYPDTDHKEEAGRLMADIDDRLAEKDLRIGIMFAKMKQPGAAQVYLQGVVKAHPRSRRVPEALLWLGRSQENGGEPAAAIATYRQLIESFPDAPATREARIRERQLAERHPEQRGGTEQAPAPP